MKLLILLLLVFSLLFQSANKLTCEEESKVDVKFSGFVKTDIFYDTRQNVAVREGHFYLYPKNKLLDENGEDINATSNFNILSVQTRGRTHISIPNVLGAKATGFIEGAFFGSAEGNINTFRLRHAYAKLDWGKTNIMIGQFWHTMFITECFPGVVSFNTGAPFQPFSRNPQVRLQQYFGDLRIEIAAVSQRDFTSTGPDGSSSKYLRNAVIPDMNIGLQYKIGKSVIGANAEYKMLMPLISYSYIDPNDSMKTTIEKTDEIVSSYAIMGYAKIVTGDFTAKVEAIYGQNLTNMTMIGGYYQTASHELLPEYTPGNLLSIWGEMIYGKDIQFALFAGYTQNMGAVEESVSSSFGRGMNIESIMRISPRVIWNIENFRLACEIEYTSAAYGDMDMINHGKIINTETVSNLRALIAAYVFF